MILLYGNETCGAFSIKSLLGIRINKLEYVGTCKTVYFKSCTHIQMPAKVMGVGQTTLYEQSLNRTGVSHQQYLTSLRMRVISKALCETEFSVQDVALRVQ